MEAEEVVSGAQGGHVVPLVPAALGPEQHVMDVRGRPAAPGHLAEALVARDHLRVEASLTVLNPLTGL